MGPTVDSRIKTPDDGIPVLHIEYEVKTTEHNSLVELCNAVLIKWFILFSVVCTNFKSMPTTFYSKKKNVLHGI